MTLAPANAKRALITGVRGFTGVYLARELAAAGYQVYGTAFGSEPTDENVHSVDLCDRRQVAEFVEFAKPDVVAHLAAIAFVGHGNVDEIYRSNVIGARNLLEALTNSGTKPSAVLLASSANVYGNAEVEPIDENVQPAPANDYAVSKLTMEYMAKLWLDKLPIIFARPFNYTGIGQSENFLLPKIVAHFRRRAPEIELGNLDVYRDFSDVRTVAAAYRRLIETAPVGETFNICSGRVYSLAEVLRMMAEIADYEIEVKVNPAFVRANEVKRLVGSCAKLQKTVGAIEAIPLSKTLEWMYRA